MGNDSNASLEKSGKKSVQISKTRFCSGGWMAFALNSASSALFHRFELELLALPAFGAGFFQMAPSVISYP
jgi:hypothetical protein